MKSMNNVQNNIKKDASLLFDIISGKLKSRYANLVIWIFFLLTSVWLLLMNLVFQKETPGDLTLYNLWMWKGFHLGIWPIATEASVYPVVAVIPMFITEIFSGGSNDMYIVVWLLLSIALNSVALYFLLNYKPKARPSCLRNVNQIYIDKLHDKHAITRKLAAIYWISFMLLMGPVYLSRIDIMQVPLCVIGVTFLLTRTELSTLMFTVAAWMKVFAGVFVFPLLFNVKKFFKKVLLPAGLLSVGIVAFCVIAFKNLNVLSFLTSQGSRGLQIESPAANPLLISEIITGKSTLYFNNALLTNELGSNIANAIANQLNYAMVIAVLIVCVLIYRARKYDSIDLFCYGGLSLVTSLILFNKVGSPQYYAIIPIAVIAMIYYGKENIKFEVIVSLFMAFFTWLLYPTFYSAFLNFNSVLHPVSVLIITVRNILLAVLFARSLYQLYRLRAKNINEEKILEALKSN